MKYSLKLLETDQQVFNLILQEIQKTLDSALNRAIPRITSEVKTLVSTSLRNQSEYISLMAGTLKAEFGLPDSSVVNSVIQAMVDSLIITKQNITIKPKSGISGGLILNMIKSDFSDIINQDIANVTTEEYALPWLKWLLLEGTASIVKNYNVLYGPSPYSRSGLAIMKNSDSDWSVPSTFAGTESDNWTTRAIRGIDKDIYNIIQNNIEKNL
jgi:hypothetical protein